MSSNDGAVYFGFEEKEIFKAHQLEKQEGQWWLSKSVLRIERNVV